MSDNLHQLIHALTQNEKRYFKLYASFMFSGEDKRFVQLFDLLVKQRSYDEKTIKEKIGNKYFAQLKQQLFGKVLGSMRAFHSGADVRSLIANYMADYRVLLSKAMRGPAVKSLRKAEVLATAYEMYAELISIKQAEIEMLVAGGDAEKLQTHISYLRDHIPNWTLLIDSQLQMEREHLLFVKLNRETEFIRSEKEQKQLDSFINTPLFRNKDHVLTARGKACYYYVMGLYHFFSGSFRKSLESFEAQLKIYEDKPPFALEFSQEYAKVLANVCLLCNKTVERERFGQIYAKLLALDPPSPALKEQVLYRNYLLQLNQYVSTGLLEEAAALISREGGEMERISDDESFAATMVTEKNYVMFDTMYVHMCSRQFSEANRIVNSYLNTTEKTLKSDQYNLARILHLFIQLELGNDDYVANEARSVRRFLREQKKLYEFEKICLRMIAQLLNEKKPALRKLAWKEFRLKLESLMESVFERNAMLSFNFIYWAGIKSAE